MRNSLGTSNDTELGIHEMIKDVDETNPSDKDKVNHFLNTYILTSRAAAGRAGHGSGRVRQIFTGRVGSRVSKF